MLAKKDMYTFNEIELSHKWKGKKLIFQLNLIITIQAIFYNEYRKYICKLLMRNIENEKQ